MRTTLLAVVLLFAVPALAQEKPAPKLQKTEFVEMSVLDVIEVDSGFAVLLHREGDDTILPIFVGPSEGLAIRLRLMRQRPPRPLTHDLLLNMVTTLGAKVVKVEVDDLKGDTFLGRIYLLQGKKQLDLDARPSDSIALAMGAGAPIRVSKRVLLKAGLNKKDLLEKHKRLEDEAPGKTESL